MNRGRNSSRRSRGFQPGKASSRDIKQQCLQAGSLFEDPDFPAEPNNIFFSRQPPRPYVWKRPRVSVHSPRVGVHSPRIGIHSPRVGVHSPRVSVHSPRVCVHSTTRKVLGYITFSQDHSSIRADVGYRKIIRKVLADTSFRKIIRKVLIKFSKDYSSVLAD